MRLKVSNVCQLFDKDNLNSLVIGNLDKITVTDNKDGTFIINGSYSNTYTSWYIINEWNVEKGNISQIVEGHKYLLLGDVEKVSGDIHLGIVIWYVDGSSQSNYAGIITSLKTTKLEGVRVQYSLHKGDTADNAISKPQLFDLTEMYGAGNEPTTVAQFRQDFPNEMYEYSPVCWKKFRRLKYIANKEPVQLYAKNIWGEGNYHGVSIKNNNDGSITLNGTATQTFYYTNRLDYAIKPNHKYLYVDYYPQTPSWDTYVGGCEGKVNHESAVMFAIYNLHNDGTIDPSSPTLPSNTLLNTFCRVYKGFTLNNVTIKPQLFDLTAMYGAGNEPTTVEQFRADFPNELYDYNPYNYLTLNRGKYIANKEPVQLLDKSKYPATTTDKGVTFTNNGDGTITANGTSAKNYASYSITTIPRPPIGHKILVLPKNNGKTQDHIYVYASSAASNSSWVDDLGYGGRIITITGIGNTFKNPYTHIGIHLNVNKDWVMNNHIYKPQLFDLTEMFGAGHEPATVAEFRQRFPNELYDYNPYNAITFR